MAVELLKMCDGCGEWFHYYEGHGAQIKKRGYSTRYYCPRCIAKYNNPINERKVQNGHIKSKED